MSEIATSQGSRYTDEDRRQAVITYSVQGNDQKVSDITGIPRQTVNAWRKQDWWESVLSEVRQEINDQIQASWSRAAQKATEALEDRIENGDVKIVQGEERRVPMSGRDLTVAAGVSTEKVLLFQGKPTSIRASDKELESKVKALEDFARSRREQEASVVSDQ